MQVLRYVLCSNPGDTREFREWHAHSPTKETNKAGREPLEISGDRWQGIARPKNKKSQKEKAKEEEEEEGEREVKKKKKSFLIERTLS